MPVRFRYNNGVVIWTEKMTGENDLTEDKFEIVDNRDREGSVVTITGGEYLGGSIKGLMIMGQALIDMVDESNLKDKIEAVIGEQIAVWYFG